MNVFKKYPNIHVVAEVYGKWDDGVSQAELTKALTAHPDVQGIINQAGEYGALQALINLKHPLNVAMTGEGSNGWRMAMLKYKDQGLKGLSRGEPPMSSALALKVAVEALEGKNPPKDQRVPLPNVTTADLKPGVNVFPDEPPTVFADIEIPGSGIELTIKDAQGKSSSSAAQAPYALAPFLAHAGQRLTVLTLHNLSKRYGVTQAVKSLSLTARPGSVLGLVGKTARANRRFIKMRGRRAPDSRSRRARRRNADAA